MSNGLYRSGWIIYWLLIISATANWACFFGLAWSGSWLALINLFIGAGNAVQAAFMWPELRIEQAERRNEVSA